MPKQFYLILMISLFLRFFFALKQPLSFDEILTFNVLHIPTTERFIKHILFHDLQTPSLYLLLLVIKNYLINSYHIFRLTLSLISTLGIYYIYKTTSKIFDETTANWSAFLYGFSFPMILFGTEMRPYAVILLLNTLLNYIYFVIEKNKFLYMLLILILSVSFHIYGFLLITPYILLEFNYLRKQLSEKPTLGFLFIGSLFTTLTLLFSYLLKHFDMNHEYRAHGKILFHVSNYLSIGFFGPLGLLIIIICSFYFFISEKNKDKNKIILKLFIISSFPLVLIFVKSLLSTPTLEPRYLIITLSTFMIIVSSFFVHLQKNYNKMLSIFFIITILFDLLFYRNFFSSFREDGKVVFEKALKESKVRNSNLYSCGICFLPYSTNRNLNYSCFGSHDKNKKLKRDSVYVVHNNSLRCCISQINNLTLLEKTQGYSIYTNMSGVK